MELAKTIFQFVRLAALDGSPRQRSHSLSVHYRKSCIEEGEKQVRFQINPRTLVDGSKKR